jgi:hypothetical protein
MGYVGMVFTRLYMVDDIHVAHVLSHLHICFNAVFENDEMCKFQGSWQEMPCERTVSLSELLCYKPF